MFDPDLIFDPVEEPSGSDGGDQQIINALRQNIPDFTPQVYYKPGYTYRYKYKKAHWINDDYMPFLTVKPNNYKEPSVEHGSLIWMSQMVPILKSLLQGTGINQGPRDTVRVHKDDIRYMKGT